MGVQGLEPRGTQVRLTERETEAALWCIHTVSLGYGHEPPDGSVLDSLKQKLLEASAPPVSVPPGPQAQSSVGRCR
jgi:hypothetical protein